MWAEENKWIDRCEQVEIDKNEEPDIHTYIWKDFDMNRLG